MFPTDTLTETLNSRSADGSGAMLLDALRVLSSRLSWGATVLLAGAAISILPDVRAQDKNPDRRPAKQVISAVANALTIPAAACQGRDDRHAEAPLRTFDVRVINARTGRPEPGVTIRVSLGMNKEGTSDTDGRYRVTGTVREFAILQVQIQKPGFVPLRVMWDNTSAEIPVEIPREYTFTLEPGSTIGGVVQDEQGRPVAEARVLLSIPSTGNQEAGKARVALDRFQTKTDAQGRWQCDIAPAHLDVISMTVEHADYLVERGRPSFRSQSPRAFAELRARNSVVVLKEGLTLAGRVTNSAGKAIGEARVSLAGSFRREEFMTDAQGRFELNHVPPGPNEVAIQARGYVPAFQKVVAAPGMVPLEVRLEAGRTISGQVVDEENEPIAGAFIQFELGPSNRAMGPRTTSDQNGRFQIEGIPADGGSMVVRRGANVVTRRVVPSEKDETFVLAAPKPEMMRVLVTVTDAASGQPIPSFNVVLMGSSMGRHAATGGRYERTLRRPPSRLGFPPLQLRIEAEGYFPSGLRTVPTDRDENALDFQLRKGSPITGVVRAPNGAPVANADLALRGPSQRIDIGDGRLESNRGFPVVHTGVDGRFTFPPREGLFAVIAAHPSGFAITIQQALAGRQNAPIDIALQPWGRVEGILKIGSQLGMDQQISLFSAREIDPLKLNVVWRLSSTTDDSGRFSFDRVLPGTIAVERTVPINPRHGLLARPIPAFEVKPGETTRLAIGGIGRPVIGKAVIPGELKAKWSQVDPSGRISCSPQPPRPYDQLTAEEQNRWGQEWEKAYRSYAFVIHSDGSFRVEDVPPGSYQLEIRVNEDYEEFRFHGSIRLGSINRTINVPDIPGGLAYTDQPLDLGSLPLELDRGVKVGDPAPDIQAKALDTGKPLKLSDYQGKYVLIVFWNSSITLSRPDALGLKAVYGTIGKDDRFIMLGLNSDTQGDEATNCLGRPVWMALAPG